MLDQAERKYLRLLQEFGLTPVSRNRVKIAKLAFDERCQRILQAETVVLPRDG